MKRIAFVASWVFLLGSMGSATAQVPAHKLPTDRNSLPQFNGITLEGDSIRSTEYKGKVTLVNFWAIWCGSCIKELPHIQSLHERYSDNEDIQIETVYIKNQMGGRSIGEVRKWVGDRNFTFSVVFDEDNSIQNAFGFRGVPLNLIVGRDGYLSKIDHTPLKTFESRVTQRINERLDAQSSSEEEK